MNDSALNTIEHVNDQFIERIAENMAAFGVSGTVGRVLGIIYMNRHPMTLDELSKATGMSKTRMSQVVREMLDLNIAEKVFEKGVRRDLYNVEQDYYQTFISLFSANWSKAVTKNKMAEKKMRKELLDALESEGLSEEAETKLNSLLAETKQWLEYYQWMENLIDFFESEEIFKHVPKPIK
ncbi:MULTISPECIES: GbsR/MarR family transcriptional regulator [Bacillaceae]|uniref:GbsR/MarR family transcriptional regulator n=1 Tax=Bacillaceae TaxID=186817 RepID=UPI000C76EBB4|nr:MULTISPECIES: GbsR/MarR family transcriptional regulator [Bacillaceae]PLR67361.1 MarR family transcriptional regulator [Bacillus sp. UMB0893]QNG59653.1 GbsR/MarR family transcriptional regulator [Bacillus sp. PAMC26568]